MKKLIFLNLLIITFPTLNIEKKHHLVGWYPRKAERLKQELYNLASFAKQKYGAVIKPSSVRAIIAPHAGINYSGAIAAAVYNFLPKQARRAIILAPDHSGASAGISLPSFDRYAMPNGTLIVDTKSIEQLSKKPNFSTNNTLFDTEHALEMQLPFIKKQLPHAQIVPLIVGAINCNEAAQLAQSLSAIIDDKTVIIVSCDFVHYGPRFNFTPFANDQLLHIQQLNSQAIELIGQERCMPFAQFMQQTKATICGANPVKLLLALIEKNTIGAVEPRLVAYDTSSKNNLDNIVSYVGMLFTREKLADKPIAEQLTQQEKENLLAQSKQTLTHLFDENFDPALYYAIKSFGVVQPHGSFVTLREGRQKRLRGCIGRIVTPEPLYKTVAQVTQDAALRDSRFSPVTKAELPNISVEISVLSQPKKVSSYKQIEVGTHGVILKEGNRSALFLPKVATEQGWSRAQLLNHLAMKAGLPKDVWKTGQAELKIFSGLDFY